MLRGKIDQIYQDNDGWWVILKEGWSIDGCIGWREDTKAKLLARVKEDAKYVPPVRTLPAETTPTYLRKKELAQVLHVSPRTIYNWASTGVIPTIRVKNVVMFDLERVKEALKLHESGVIPPSWSVPKQDAVLPADIATLAGYEVVATYKLPVPVKAFVSLVDALELIYGKGLTATEKPKGWIQVSRWPGVDTENKVVSHESNEGE